MALGGPSIIRQYQYTGTYKIWKQYLSCVNDEVSAYAAQRRLNPLVHLYEVYNIGSYNQFEHCLKLQEINQLKS